MVDLWNSRLAISSHLPNFTEKTALIVLSDIIAHLEKLAPPAYQESYDNAGLITGSPEMQITGAVICIDSTENVIDEAISLGCNLVIAHHPIVFTGLKKFIGSTYVERVIIKAIRNNIAIYAIHTNLDNVKDGVNRKLAEKLGLSQLRILSPKKGLLKKLVTYCPQADADRVKNALFSAGAGSIGNYDECSFGVQGTGTFRGNESSNPVVGQRGTRHHEQEERIELIFEGFRQAQLLKVLRSAHPYEEIAFDIYSIDNQFNNVGSGMLGMYEIPMAWPDFLRQTRDALGVPSLRYTEPVTGSVTLVAVCGGSGSFLLPEAIRAGADAFVTADFKYHQFFDAVGMIAVVDAGHYETEQFTKDLIYESLKEKFTTFAVHLSGHNTNPINYF